MKNCVLTLLIFVITASVVTGKAFSMGEAPRDIQIAGKIVEVDQKAMTIKIIPVKGKSEILRVNERTRLVRGGKNITLPGIKKNDQATVTYRKSWGRKIAVTVTVKEQAPLSKKSSIQKKKR